MAESSVAVQWSSPRQVDRDDWVDTIVSPPLVGGHGGVRVHRLSMTGGPIEFPEATLV